MAGGRSVPESADDSITGLLAQLGQGNREVEARLVAQVYYELRHLARNHMRKERANHTLQPTALVNEAYLQLLKQPVDWQNRAHFFAVTSDVMREILVDHARAKHSRKRGGDKVHVTFGEYIASPDDRVIDVLELNQLLEGLKKLDPKLSRLLELHFFGGLSFEEIGHVMQVSSRTVETLVGKGACLVKNAAGKMSVGTPGQTTRRADAATARLPGPVKDRLEKLTFCVTIAPRITLPNSSGPGGRQERLNGRGTRAFHVSQQRAPRQP
jgi:RNA polymerase sigma-70 factor (ECF subfamily)